MELTARGLLALPSFFYGVFLLFWCFQLAALTGFIKFWRLDGRRSDVSGVLRFLKAAFRVRLVRLGERGVCTDRKCMYLVNHRGWSDFFIDMYIVGGRALPLSRLAVGMAFPAFTSSLVAIRSILLFNRAGVRDTEKFNRWLDDELKEGPQNSLLVYPEGTRSQKQVSLPLKRGMLRYAFSRRLPVQAIITASKEEVLNEKRMWAHFNRKLVVGCSEMIETAQFDDFETFVAAVQAMWDALWERTHAASPEGLPEMPPSNFPAMQYSARTVLKQTAALGFWMAVLLATLFYTAKAVLAVAALPTVGLVLVAALGLYTAASLAAAALLPAPRAKVRGSGTSAPAAPAAAAADKTE